MKGVHSPMAVQWESEESISMHLIERHVSNLMNIGHFSLVLSQTSKLWLAWEKTLSSTIWNKCIFMGDLIKLIWCCIVSTFFV